ncbi:MAG TPA: hypothetical protein VGJ13_05090 [Pseudonocardiaceae bacterium]
MSNPLAARLYCATCDKYAYPDRKTARQAIRRFHPGSQRKGLDVYRCAALSGNWHVGHSWRRRSHPAFSLPQREGPTA